MAAILSRPQCVNQVKDENSGKTISISIWYVSICKIYEIVKELEQ